jgi:hypothetical protein
MKKIKDLVLVIVILFIHFTNTDAQNKFDEKTAYLYMLKSSPGIIDDYVLEYLYRFENAQYHIYTNDEFECQRVATQITGASGSLKNDNVYYLESKASFGIYDFTNESFGFAPINLAETIEIVKYLFSSRSKTNTKIDAHFNNGDEITQLPLKKEQANYLLKLKKNQKTGKVDRTVNIRILFNVDQRSEIDTNNGTKTRCDLYLNILSIEVFDNPDFASAPMISIPTIYKAQKDAGKQQATK